MRFNRNQKAVLLAGTVLALVIGIYPPWIMEGAVGKEYSPIQVPLGYGVIFAPPIPDVREIESRYNGVVAAQYVAKEGGVQLDMPRLIAQWITVVLVAIGLMLYFRD